MVAAPTDVIRQVISVLDALGISYVIGGSFASSAHGEARSTRGPDLVVWRGRLDEAYLDRWAAELRVSDLLERTRRAIAPL